MNSANGISTDHVDELFPYAEANGSVRLTDINEQIRRDNVLIRISDLVIGRVAIRKTIEFLGQEFRGKPYTKRQANNFLEDACFIRELKGMDGNTIGYSDCSSLSGFVENKYKDGQDAHRRSLKKARIVKGKKG